MRAIPSLTPAATVVYAYGAADRQTGVVLPTNDEAGTTRHGDHLGSTLLLTCHLVGTACADGTVGRRFRYDAYGQPAAYTPSGQIAPDRGAAGQRLPS